MAGVLSAFLRRSCGRRFAFGECDCALWVADWIVEAHGIDPAASIRGRYKSRLGCLRLANRHGGLAAYAAELLDAAGLERTADPRPGDVGIISTSVGDALAIRVSRGWAWKAERGVTVVPANYLVAWSI